MIFEGYSIERRAGSKWLDIRKPNGNILGQAWSMPGAKRMVRKDAGTNVCECGHLPTHHYEGLNQCFMRPCSCKLTRSQATTAAKYRRERILSSR